MRVRKLALNAVCALIVYVFMAPCWAADTPSGQTRLLTDTLGSAGAKQDVRQLLDDHHDAFGENFTATANPVLLKDGGIFLDGWRVGDPGQHAAAFVHYVDGRTYAAYFDAERGKVIYFGDLGGRIHPAIEVWARRFGPPVDVILKANPAARALANPPRGTAAAPSPGNQVELRKVAASIWNGSLAARWDMNAEVGDILGIVTHEIMECSVAFSLVPKPAGWVPGWLYVAESALSIVTYVTGVSKDRQYKACVNTAALNWRSAIELASAGI
ncbi:hypothetical protein [Melittangium boletus]|uniref:Lipoprotein n=1 Tax=Melittangium boletus DSM 14713 TaxID=1294270 RepID=A0A250IRR1_9BACT|nr:hypothetical protein [Melittangium boletus]ATB34429.1 hypothetical protein MEBOL_007932 [Melittangium boletus DSM 14713]